MISRLIDAPQSMSDGTARKAARVTVAGVVQGVGFRPFVHRLANEFDVVGWVRNASGQVEIHVEGDADAVDAFAAAIPLRLPTLARIDTINAAIDIIEGAADFRILDSQDVATARLQVPADVVTCEACRAELFDPSNRRFHYPFATCTDCGPRYTVIEALPYDRERTSLRTFPLCAACQREYDSPQDRRFHAESTACPDCGPHLRFVVNDGQLLSDVIGDDAVLRAAADALKAGGIVAVRGLGGFHVAVDATNSAAVTRLRLRKRRDAKPLACMVRSIAEAEQYADITAAESQWLSSRERPIVLVTLRALATGDADRALAPAVAPGLDRVGLMLPSTPLHYLLLDLIDRPLVMTSGNLADEPLAADNAEARERLSHIADAMVLHDRDIVARVDDSVVRLAGERPILLRRARGYAPLPIGSPISSPVPLLAVGAHLKNTFTFLHGAHAYVSPHIGDLDSIAAVTHWRAVRDRYASLFRIQPEAVVADLHDGYLSTREAETIVREQGLGPLIRVQHHHAHIAAVAAEHGVTHRVLGVAFDGTGAGTDGNVWGMEFLTADLSGFERVAHLRPAPLPGGDRAVRMPWRTLAGYLSLNADVFTPFAIHPPHVSDLEQRIVAQQIAHALNAPLASSAGRLFDAVASLLDLCHVARFEGDAAMQLEACANDYVGAVLPFPWHMNRDGMWTLDPVPLLVALLEGRARGDLKEQLAADFHESVAFASIDLAIRLAEEHGLETIVLAGGCFQNARLLTTMSRRATAMGFRVLTAQRLPTNDGGISYGQAVVGAAQLQALQQNGASLCV